MTPDSTPFRMDDFLIDWNGFRTTAKRMGLTDAEITDVIQNVTETNARWQARRSQRKRLSSLIDTMTRAPPECIPFLMSEFYRIEREDELE